MMSPLLEGFFGLKRPRASRRGPDKLRKGRRFVPRSESLEGRITMTVNLAMSKVSIVDSQDNILAHIYAGEQVYVRADFTTENLPFNAKYRIRATTPDINGVNLDSPYYKDGAGAFFNQIYSFHEFFGPFTANPQGALKETLMGTVNFYRDVTEKSDTGGDPYADNSMTVSFPVIATAEQLMITVQPPPTVRAGAVFGFQAAVEDMYGNVVANDEGPVSTTVATGPPGSVLGGGGSTGDGTVMVTAMDGYANFSGLTLNKVGTVTLDVFRAGLTDAFTNPIIVTPGDPYQLVITQEPNASVAAGDNIGLQVAVEDQDLNPVTSDNTTKVTATLASGVGPFVAPASVTAQGGYASFNTNLLNSLSDDTAQAMITIDVNGVSVVSGVSKKLTKTTTSGVAITPAVASQLVIQGQPSSTATVGQKFATQPILWEEDRYGNLEKGDSTTVVTASPTPGAGALLGSSTATVSDGLASFASLGEARAGTMSLKFSSGNLTTVTSGKIVVGKGTPTIQWSSLVPLAIGSPLGAAQLDATAGNFFGSVAGTFAYSPALGTVLSPGPHVLTVNFTPASAGDYYTPAAMTATVIVQPPTTTTLTASGATVTYEQPITFTAAVSPAAGGAMPTGSVSFFDGTTLLGSSTLDGTGHASFKATSLPAGTPSITALYSGDSTDTASTSPAKVLSVHNSVGGDFDGDGRADIGVYDQDASAFIVLESGGGSILKAFGNATHVNIAIPGDFDGDGKTDLAIYDQTASEFIVLESGGGSLIRAFGNASHVNIPIAGDFDGDGKTDLAIYDQTASEFIVLESGGGSLIRAFGNATHVNIPIAGDFDGDGKTDLAIYDQTASTFIVLESGGGSLIKSFGNATHVNVPIGGDFDGDGKTDLAIYDQTAAAFIVLESGGGSIFKGFGSAADVNIPLAGDFDGDGKSDLAVYDQTVGLYFIIDSGGGGVVQPFGNAKHRNIPV